MAVARHLLHPLAETSAGLVRLRDKIHVRPRAREAAAVLRIRHCDPQVSRVSQRPGERGLAARTQAAAR